MCNSQLWLRSESTCIPSKVFSVQKSDETSSPIMCSQSQDYAAAVTRRASQSQYIYGNSPPWKTPWLGKLYHCWVKTTEAPALFWYRHMIWPTISQLRSWRTEVWSHEVICAGIVPKSAAPVWVPSPGAFLLVCWDAALLLSGGSWHPVMDPLWLDQLPPFILCTVQYYFPDVPSILKRLWSCYVTLFSWDPSLPHVPDSSPYSVEDWELRDGQLLELLFINIRMRADLWSGKAPFCVLILAGLLPNLLVAQKLVCWSVLAREGRQRA